jgi:hypothetical protein
MHTNCHSDGGASSPAELAAIPDTHSTTPMTMERGRCCTR